MTTLICKICGKTFESKSSRRKICYEDHYHPCPVCGKLTIGNDLQHLNSCCSTECSRKKATSTIHEKYNEWPSNSAEAKKKRCETNISRYGVDNPSKLDNTKSKIKESLRKTWIERGEEIIESAKATSREKYGHDYYMQSDEGKQKVEKIFYSKYGVKTSLLDPEVQDKISASNVERYGFENPFCSDEIRERIKITNLERYGSEYSASNKYVRAKMQATIESRYRVEYPLQSKDISNRAKNTYSKHMEDESFRNSIQAKRKQTNLERYGTENAMESEAVQKRIRQTNLHKYGCAAYPSSDDFKTKSKQTFLERYNVENPMQNDSIKRKFSEKLFDAKGITWPSQSKMTDKSKINELLLFREDPVSYIFSLPETERTETCIANRIGVTPSNVSNYVCIQNLHPYVKFTKSRMEDEISKFLSNEDIKFIRNYRKVITPYELDFYLPDFKVGIECNPTATHNSSFSDPWGQPRKMPSYHKMKTDMCEKQGVFLFHIFGYEWENKREIILSMLRNILGMSKNKIFARNTYVCNLSNEDCCKFLDANHRQGSLSASIRLGLRKKDTDELVSVMTFNKIRNTIGYTGEDNFVELSRFCSKLNTSVVGGASKLFKYFIDTNEKCNIVSFSDRAHTKGNLYSKLGFEHVKSSYPGYVWVNVQDDSYYNRVSCQKKNLRKLLRDNSIDIDKKTEKEIMEEHGYAQVFDSGTVRWEYKAE